MALVAKEDFDFFRKNLTQEVKQHSSSPHFIPFLTELLQDLCQKETPEHILRLSNILNEMVKEEPKVEKNYHEKKVKKKLKQEVKRKLYLLKEKKKQPIIKIGKDDLYIRRIPLAF